VNIQGFDISSRILAEEKLRKREKQYLSLSNLGRISISCKDFQAILEKSARLISEHPANSYQLIRDKYKKIESIEITDPAQFWKISKYAVVEITN